MILNVPETELFAKGHRACAGCGAALAMRYILKASGKNTIVAQATGCMEVISTPYPETAWRVPYIHVAFENAAAVASGIDRALRVLGKREEINVVAIGGDGGTFDIGLQALSGALERGERFVYICYANEGYMNTGVQRSSDTPKYSSTTTSPAGKKIHGKVEFQKQMPFIAAAHGCYVATANVAFPQDFIKKVQKALSIKGPSYVQVYTPCPPGWKIDDNMTIEISKLAFNAKITPLYEIENGILTISKQPKDIPVKDYLKFQGRFRHLNDSEIEEIQKYVNSEWERIKKLDETKVRI